MSRRELWYPPERMADGTVRIRTIPLPPPARPKQR
jgi:hypothetical protein